MKTILWDWNGTLLDDVQVSFDCLNDMLRLYHKPEVPSVDAYRAIFRFPVKEYYALAGIGDDLFDEVAPRWMDDYMAHEGACLLRRGAAETLRAFHEAGFRQVILSASKRQNLLGQMARFDILLYFDEVLGLDHIYATSKEGIGRAWMERAGVNPADCAMIGDTLHDADVARALGVRCILLCDGHQLKSTLQTAGCEVAGNMKEVKDLILHD